MDAKRIETLRWATGALAIVVAGVHLYWGIPRFVAYASIGEMPDPRPLAFVLSGHAIMIAITLVAVGRLDTERTYLPGIGFMAIHVIGYAAWHTVLAHGVSEAATDHTHSPVNLGNIVVVTIEHAVNSPLALLAKSTELAVIGLLTVLYLRGNRG